MLRASRLALICSMSLLLGGAGVAHGQGVLPTATLTVTGVEQQPNGSWDSGNIGVDFNGFVEIINYGQYSSNASLASGLAAMFVRDYHSFGLYAKAGVNAAQPNVVTFQLADGSGFGPLNVVDPSVSFSLAGSGFASSSATTADIGVATLTIQNQNSPNQSWSYPVNYGDGSNGESIAQDIASVAASSPAGSPVTVTSEGPNVFLKVKQPSGSYNYSYSLTFSTSQSFSTSTPASGNLTGSTDVAPITVYSYCVGPVNPCPATGGTSGYQPNGNVQNLNDSIMGNWTYGYDNLNRLTSGIASGGPYDGDSTCWSYDSFGNRTSQSVSAIPCNANPPATFAATYSANNQINSVTTPVSTAIAYDTAGNVTDDGFNTYTYDAEGRVCALNGPQGMIGYQYDANGNRVGKGTVTTIATCDITANGYTPITDYVLDQSGGQMTEMAIMTTTSGTTTSWVHSNVTAAGALIATFDTTGSGLHFYLNDALGSRRVQTDAAGIPEQVCQSLPFGDQLYCTGSLSNPTEHHFTGKERDAESGLDYFGARYYGSNMGRFMSPDPSNLGIDFRNPQSWNHYAYVLNNPLNTVDKNGLWPTRIHNDIIDKAFPGLSASERQILKDASYQMDHGPDSQEPAFSFEHSMSDGDNPSLYDTQTAAGNFVSDQEGVAAGLQSDWGAATLNPTALLYFGFGNHTVSDGTSPAHEGGQPWYGVWHLSSAWHWAREQHISSARMNQAVNAERQHFRQTFGDAFYFYATRPSGERTGARIIPPDQTITPPDEKKPSPQ
jgi:RHS repeat-associated protein